MTVNNLAGCSSTPHRHPRARRLPRGVPGARQRGVALFEALVSILIFSFGVLGLLGLESKAINYSVDAENRNRAALFANDVASVLWGANSVTVSGAQKTQWDVAVADPTAAGLPNGLINLTPVAGTTNATDIVITWQPPQRGTGPGTTSTLTTRVTLP